MRLKEKQLVSVASQVNRTTDGVVRGWYHILKKPKTNQNKNKLYLSCSTTTTHAATTTALPLLATHASVSEAPVGSLLPPAGSREALHLRCLS